MSELVSIQTKEPQKIQRDGGLGEELQDNIMQSIDLIPSTNQKMEIGGLNKKQSELFGPSLSSAKVVSFVDKQLQLTQQRQAQLESSLSEMMEAIEDNARLQLNLHDLTLEVMQAQTLEQAIALIQQGLKQRFDLRDAQIWGQPNSILPKAVPTEAMGYFLTYMQTNPLAFGAVSAFPMEVWGVTGVLSGCAFRLSAYGQAYGVMVLGRGDHLFDEAADTLFLQQFVDVMGVWLARLGAFNR